VEIFVQRDLIPPHIDREYFFAIKAPYVSIAGCQTPFGVVPDVPEMVTITSCTRKHILWRCCSVAQRPWNGSARCIHYLNMSHRTENHSALLIFDLLMNEIRFPRQKAHD
jgi:hypothetical protein